MDLTEKDNSLSCTQRCVSCLYFEDDRVLQNFKLQNEALKAVFQVDYLCLCYLCKRKIENAELYIQTVLNNQILLENLTKFSDETISTLTSQTQPLSSLSKLSLDIIELDGSDTQTSEPTLVYKYGVYKDSQVKMEFKVEDENYLDSAANDFIDEIDFDYGVKEEEGSLENALETESNLAELQLVCLGTNLGKSKVKKKSGSKKKNTDFDNGVKEEECLLENVLETESNLAELQSVCLGTNLKESKVKKKSGSKKKNIDLHQDLKDEDLDAFYNSNMKDKHIPKNLEKDEQNIKRDNVVINSENNFKIKKFYITRAQCMKELAQKAKEKTFLNSPYKCRPCVKGFTFKPSYDKHLELHSKPMGDFECDVCTKRMDTEEKMTRHKKSHKMRFECGVCGLVRITMSAITDHYTEHHSTGTEDFICKLCSKTFKRQILLRKHNYYWHNNKERVTCAYCGKTYANKDVLKSHIIAKHAEEVSPVDAQKRYMCKVCGKALKTPSQLKMHSTKHSHKRDYYCVECDKRFKTKGALKQHLKIATPHVVYNDLPLACSHCDKKFAIKRDLERHMNGIHLNIKPFQCDKCDKAYVSNWSLKEHKQVVHEGYKRPLKYPCPMCDKVFDRNPILKVHIRTHTGERPYQCSKCPATFSQSGVLNTHMKLIHLKLNRDGRPKRSLK
ncbi:unnamed protein product [Parnassius apollo]|uniref:(apollo) hypothetical protein n=1 Tax=Parnassius apollo TaxID=110799 RepID=A0A8S3Y8Z1_PARAO|nr:unnamed protein product [Parnassius apollo]